jgi:hypothetical protein
MDIAASTDTPVRLPTIEVRPKADPSADAASSASGGTDAKPDFWHRAFGKDGFTFSTLLDIVNPLQHIPVVSTIYQKLTGDVASPGANLIGGALFGGAIGLAVAGADTAIKDETGKDIGDHVFAMFDSGNSDAAPVTAVASNAASTDATPADIDATADATSEVKNIGAPTATVADATPPQTQSPTKPAVIPAPAPVAKIADAKPVAPASATPASAKRAGTPFAFAMNNRHAAGNGIGGSYVPLESRASIAPAAWQVTAPSDDALAGAPKLAQKPAEVTLPDLKALAANPDMLRQLQQNGMRKPAVRPNAAPNPVSAKTAQPPAMLAAPAPSSAADAADATATGGNADGNGNNADYASLMARNLARYMALQNKNAAPAKVNQRY